MKRRSPTLTVIIPSIGYPTLADTLGSIRTQHLLPGDEVLVVGDGTQPATRALVEAAGPPFSYLDGPLTHRWGNAQRNVGLARARGDYLVWMDEDDAFAPHAFTKIRRRAAAHPGRPLMFRFRTPGGAILWERRRVASSGLGGHGFVTPNVPGRVGAWGDRYEGDFDFITSTLALHTPGALVWCRPIVAICRPRGQANAGSLLKADLRAGVGRLLRALNLRRAKV